MILLAKSADPLEERLHCLEAEDQFWESEMTLEAR